MTKTSKKLLPDEIWAIFRRASSAFTPEGLAAGVSMTFQIEGTVVHVDTYDRSDAYAVDPDDYYQSVLYCDVMNAATEAGVRMKDPDGKLCRALEDLLGLSYQDAEMYIHDLREAGIIIAKPGKNASPPFIDMSLDDTLYHLLENDPSLKAWMAKRHVAALRSAGVTIGMIDD